MSITVNRAACESEDQYNYLVNHIADIGVKLKNEEQAWIDLVRSGGIIAGIQNDGWVDRKKQEFHIVKFIFNDGMKIGSVVALKGSFDYQLVQIIGKRNGTSITADWIYWQYDLLGFKKKIKEAPDDR